MKKRILIVDDDEGILTALQILLESEGYEVILCPECDHFVIKTMKAMPDVILIDLLLSGQDGADIVKNIKQEPQLKKIPIIMMSAHPSAEDRALKAGVTEFVAKPFETAQLLATIKKYTS